MLRRVTGIAFLTGFFLLVFSAARAQDSLTLPAANLNSPYAPFIYSHEFAIASGATAEWHQMEGVAVDAARHTLYVAVTNVRDTMSDDQGDIHYPKNRCGMILQGTLDDNFNLTALHPILYGQQTDPDNPDSACDSNFIARPDNLFVDATGNLWIGEDVDQPVNQFLWMWDGSTLRRFASLPVEAEVTGLRIQPDGTIFLNIQHPSIDNPYPFDRATVGVITGYTAGTKFNSLPVPTGDDTRTLMLAAGQYQVLARFDPDTSGSLDFGTGLHIRSTPESSALGACENADGNMFLPVNGNDKIGLLYTNWECRHGRVSRMAIQRSAAGTWTVTDAEMVDMSQVEGSWSNCNGSVTPWNTALSSEEDPPDVQAIYTERWLTVKDRLSAEMGRTVNMLDYGYTIEMTPLSFEPGSTGTHVVRHFAMGRFSKEITVVMPDSKTVYFGDDGINRVLYKFVADNPADLSSGTLYAAKIVQTGDVLNLTWLELGHGNDADIGAVIDALDEA